MKKYIIFLLLSASFFLLLPACKKKEIICTTHIHWDDDITTYDSEMECENKSAGTCRKVIERKCN